jgi:hypothetical protein
MSALQRNRRREKTMPIAQPRPRRRKSLDAGPFAPEIGSFRQYWAAEGKAPKTVRIRWLAEEEEEEEAEQLPDPMSGLRAPKMTKKAGASVRQRRAFGAAEDVPGPVVRPAA